MSQAVEEQNFRAGVSLSSLSTTEKGMGRDGFKKEA